MNTIPHKVIFTKIEYAELKKEFAQMELNLKEQRDIINSQSLFIDKLSKIVDIHESVTNNASELFIKFDHMSDKKPILYGKK